MSNRFMGVYAHSPTVKNEVFILDNMLGDHPDKCFVVHARALNSEFYEKLKSWSYDQEAQHIPTFFKYLEGKYFPNIRDKDALNVLHTKGFLATVDSKDVFLKVANGEQMSIRDLNEMIMEKNPEIKAKAEKAIVAHDKQPTTAEQVATQMVDSIESSDSATVVDSPVSTESVTEYEPVDVNAQLMNMLSQLSEQVESLSQEVETLKSKPKRGRKPKAETPPEVDGSDDNVFPN